MTVWTIPDGITEITRGYVIDNMPEGTTEIEIPDGVKSIGDAAFNGHTNLQSVVIPESVECIGAWAFRGCTSLKSVVIPGRVKSIGDQAFSICTGLQSVVIPEGVKSIGDSAFCECTSLKSVTIPGSVKEIENRVFLNCINLQLVVIPEGVESIGHGAFCGCTRLKSVVIPEGVESIGHSVFVGCKSLKSITIPEGIQSIAAQTFRGCKSLESVVIPGNVQIIGHSVFSECIALNLIVLPDVLVDNRSQYGITANQTVIRYGDFIEWKRDHGLVGKSYSDQAILFLYQLQNIESFKPSWNEVLKQCPEVGVEDMLYFSARTDLHHQLTTVVSIYREEVKIGDNLIKDEIMSYLNIADLLEYESSEVNILTSQSLFSRLCSEVQSLKAPGFFGVVALTIAAGVGYMQRHSGDKYSP